MPRDAAVIERWGRAKARGYTQELGAKATYGKRMLRRVLIGFVLPITIIVLFFAGLYFTLPETTALRLWSSIFNWAVLGLTILGFFLGAFSKGENKVKNAFFYAIIFGVATIFFIFFLPNIAPYIPQSFDAVIGWLPAPVKNFYFQLKSQALESQKAFEEALSFSKPKVQAPADKNIRVEFFNAVNKTPLDVAARVSVRTNEEMRVRVKCLLDNVTITATPSELTFEKSSGEQQRAVTCSNSFGGKELSLITEAPFITETTQELYVGTGERRGKIPSIQLRESPYSLSLELGDDQPLTARPDPYLLLVKFFRQESSARMKSLEFLRISTPNVPSYSLRCNPPLESMTFSGDRQKLDSAVNDKKADGFVFLCNIAVLERSDVALRSFINANASYIIEHEFKTSLRQP